MITVIFFLSSHKYTNSAFCSWILFFTASTFFRISFPIKPTYRRSFWFLETQGSTISSIYELLLLSREPQDSIDTTVLSCLFLLCNIRTAKQQERYISISPLN